MFNIPYFISNNKKINEAYRLATASLVANVLPFKDGILENEEPVIIAGLGYNTPWTRDAAINTWNAGGLLCPDVAKNTLKSVVGKDENGYYIDGEYWDRIIWTIGAWYYYLYTGDKNFLDMAYNAVCNSLEYFENTEFSEELNLFRGAACYGDGVSAYPDVYAQHGRSGIISFSTLSKDLCEEKGVGIPIYALSTNCLYYYSYILADKMAEILGYDAKYSLKAENIKNAINAIFWNENNCNYNYIYDKFGGCDSQEGLGAAFAILFGVANSDQKDKIFKSQVISEHGIPCVYPSFGRYSTPDGLGFGRHSGTVWPHVQGFWASAAAESKKNQIFDFEFKKQTDNAIRFYQFAEIYHPLTGEIYGGRQEDKGDGIREWLSKPVQTWSATAYLRNVYFDLMGMKFKNDGIHFCPIGTQLIQIAELKNFKYRNSILNIKINGNGTEILKFKLNGLECSPFVSADISGENLIEIIIGN